MGKLLWGQTGAGEQHSTAPALTGSRWYWRVAGSWGSWCSWEGCQGLLLHHPPGEFWCSRTQGNTWAFPARRQIKGGKTLETAAEAALPSYHNPCCMVWEPYCSLSTSLWARKHMDNVATPHSWEVSAVQTCAKCFWCCGWVIKPPLQLYSHI